MLSGRADSGESRMREICMSGSTRERGAAVIDAIVFHSVLSSLLYRMARFCKTVTIQTRHSRQTPDEIMKIAETQRLRIEESLSMKTKSIVLFVVLLIASARLASAADNLNETLQKGLLEEEANHNLDAAIQAYQSVVNQFDDQRKITATAVFRLGECYRKQGKTNEAVAQYTRVGRDFADQEALVKLSAQNLSALGTSASSFQQRLQQILPQSGLDEDAKEIQRYREWAQNSPDLLNAKDSGG